MQVANKRGKRVDEWRQIIQQRLSAHGLPVPCGVAL